MDIYFQHIERVLGTDILVGVFRTACEGLMRQYVSAKHACFYIPKPSTTYISWTAVT